MKRQMPTVRRLLNEKGRQGVISLPPHASVFHAQDKMIREDVGSVLVMNENGELLGIVTERDIARKLGIEATDRSPVTKIMTSDVITVSPLVLWEEALTIMRDKHITHLPVTEASRVVGVISERDVRDGILKDNFFRQQLKMEGRLPNET